MTLHRFRAVADALRRAKEPIVWMAVAYLLGLLAGGITVHTGNAFALRHRDDLVGTALRTDSAAVALKHGFPVRAAFFDFAGNLTLGAMPSTVMGLSVVMPFPWAAYRGWIGGIVSVDGDHRSRLWERGERWYYLGVLLLQLLPYSLAGGTGVRLGLGFLRPNSRFGYPGSARWLGLPAEGVRDVLCIYAVVIPLFLAASLVEFLAR